MVTHPVISVSYVLSSLFLFTACRHLTANPRPKPLPQDPYIQVYFNQNQAEGANYKDPYRNIPRDGDNLEQIIIDTIHSAKTSVDIAVQEFRLPNLAKELATLQKKGIKVRIILENNYNRPLSELISSEVDQLGDRDQNSYHDYFTLIDQNKDKKLSLQEISEGDALVILKNANVPLIDDTADHSKGSGLMHHKFIIIDQSTVIISSANLTLSDVHGDYTIVQSRGNANHLLKIKNVELAKVFTQEFNLMWQKHQFGIKKLNYNPTQIQLDKTNLTIKFSPNSSKDPWNLTSNGLIENTLSTAIKSVDLALFVFSEQRLSNALENRHQQGIKIRALIDPTFAFLNYSEGLDMLGVALSNKCRYEKNNQPWKDPIKTVGIPQLPQGDKLHHKFALIDENTIITGSHNWSASANYQNDETVLILKSSIIAPHFKREFERLYKNASLGVPEYLQSKIKQEQKNCKK